MRVDASIPRSFAPLLPVLGSSDIVAPGTNTGTVAPSSGTLYFVPVFLRNRVTLDRLYVEVTGAGDAGSVCRLGIYADTGNLMPGSLVLDAGTVSTAAVATLSITISQAVGPGPLWLAGVTQTASSLPQYRTSTGQPYTVPSSSAASTGHTGRTQTGVSGALPSAAAPSGIAANSIRVQARVL